MRNGKTTGLTLSAPAKINLYLDVIGCRDDGYHELETVFLPLFGLNDTVDIAVAASGAGLTFHCDNAQLPDDDGNLCVRAAEEFAKFAHCGRDCCIRLSKRIPVAAGLGGGSSDAATVLLGLNRLHGDVLSREELGRLALGLGADVPFFLEPMPALGRGVGEELEPLSVASSPVVVLANPMVPVSTRWAFRQLNPERFGRCTGSSGVVSALRRGDLRALATGMDSVFDPIVCEKFPICALIKERMMDSGASGAMVSGSGPTIFGVCDGEDMAGAVAAALREFFKDSVWVWHGHAG